MVIKSIDNGYSTAVLQESETDLAYKYYDIYVIKNDNKEVLTHYPAGTEKKYVDKLYRMVVDTMEVAK